MKNHDKFFIGLEYLKTMVLDLKRPLFVSWQLTERCNLRCKYCLSSGKESDEIDLKRALDVITSLHRMGTKVIRFTGGEPLLRNDLPEIVRYCHKLGIQTGLASNGVLFANMVRDLRLLSAISFSLDGPKSVHDSLRGLGTHQLALQAIQIAKEHGLYTSVSVTITKSNIESIDYLLDLARQLRVKIFFQPVTDRTHCDDEIRQVIPDIEHYRGAIEKLIREKSRNKYIGNSVEGLKHLSLWPKKSSINCVAGRVIVRINANGDVYACPNYRAGVNRLNIKDTDIEECFNQLTPPCCDACWCGLFVELNLLSRLRPSLLINALLT